MRIGSLLAALVATFVARAAASAEAGPEAFRFAPVGGLERAEGATALAADAARGRLAVGDARGVWLREGDGRVRRALGSGPVHDLAFTADGVLLAATERGLYEIGLDARVQRRVLGPGGAGRARRVLAAPPALFVATDAGVVAALPGAPFRPLDGALPNGETSALAWCAEGGAAGTLYTIVAGDLYAASLAKGLSGLTAVSFRREPLADQGGAPLDLALRPLDGAPVLLREHALATRGEAGWETVLLVLPPGLEPLRVSLAPSSVWIATDAGLMGAPGPAGPWQRAPGPAGGAAAAAVVATAERVFVAGARGVFAGEPAAARGAAISPAPQEGVRLEPQPSEAAGPEPSVQAVQRAALRYLELGRERLLSLQRRAGQRGLLPELTLRGDYGGFRARDEDHDDTVFASGGRFQLLDRLNERGRDFLVGAALRWELGNTVYDPEEIDASKEVRELIELRDEVLDEINQLYFERRRILLERARLAEPAGLEAERLGLRARELAAGLDAWTGGWWSRQVEPHSPRANDSQEDRP